MKTLPQPVQDAIHVLSSALSGLGQINGSGYGAYGVMPADVAVPTPTTKKVIIGVQGPFDQRVYGDRNFILWPQDQYAQWRSAWAILMGYTGWWGSRADWPLGDGDRAATDLTAAGHLPPAVAALTAIQSTLTVVAAPTWIPDVRWTAIGSIALFAIGGVAAFFGARKFAEDHLHGLEGSDRGAALLGWNLGRFMTHAYPYVLRRKRR